VNEWCARQLLPPPERLPSIVDVVRLAGWLQSAGGTGPYLSLRARLPGVTRQQVDEVLFRRFEVVEVPSVRDSTMLVPRDDVALALAAGRRGFADRLKKVEKLGVTRKELDTLSERVMKTIGDGVRSVDQLRHDIPPKLIRDLGEGGKQIALTSTLAVALRMLQIDGRLTRIPEDHRLDGTLHFYRASPLTIGAPPADLDRALAERFVAWAAPATVEHFAWWAGIGKRVAKAALESIDVPPIDAIEKNFVALIPFRDNLLNLHHNPLHHNAIVIDGAIAGEWEYDRDAESIVWRCHDKPPRELAAAVRATEEFIREQLGDHRFYALDHMSIRAKRIDELRG
jgi:hypothetical protein